MVFALKRDSANAGMTSLEQTARLKNVHIIAITMEYA
jgi:hypothetical protein